MTVLMLVLLLSSGFSLFQGIVGRVFFFPTYLRYFLTRPRLRMFEAIFAAAFFGDLYYSALRDGQWLTTGEFVKIWQYLSPRFLFCFLLAVGIHISMLRQQKRRGRPAETASRARRIGRIAIVSTSYSMIHIWNLRSESLTFLERTGFFLSQFGF